MTMWLATSLAAVVGLLVVLAALLLEPPRRGAAPPERGPVTPDDLRAAHLPLATRGYDPGAVDALLARAAGTLEALAATLDDVAEAARTPAEEDEPPGDRASGEELEDGGGDGAWSLDG